MKQAYNKSINLSKYMESQSINLDEKKPPISANSPPGMEDAQVPKRYEPG
jgi:hypothetical protein